MTGPLIRHQPHLGHLGVTQTFSVDPAAAIAIVGRASPSIWAPSKRLLPSTTCWRCSAPLASTVGAATLAAASHIVGSMAELDTVVTTRNFVRPRCRAGVLTLEFWAAVDERLVPFEVPNPTPCCAVHG